MTSPKISHLVFNTANYEAMKQWYLDVFEATIGVETSDHSACFLQTDEHHHRIGMFNVTKTDESAAMTAPGSGDASTLARLNHFAFEYPTLAELFEHVRAARRVLDPPGGIDEPRAHHVRVLPGPGPERGRAVL